MQYSLQQLTLLAQRRHIRVRFRVEPQPTTPNKTAELQTIGRTAEGVYAIWSLPGEASPARQAPLLLDQLYLTMDQQPYFVNRIRVQRIRELTLEDATAAGYATVADYQQAWIDTHGSDSWRCNEWVWVLDLSAAQASGQTDMDTFLAAYRDWLTAEAERQDNYGMLEGISLVDPCHVILVFQHALLTYRLGAVVELTNTRLIQRLDELGDSICISRQSKSLSN